MNEKNISPVLLSLRSSIGGRGFTFLQSKKAKLLLNSKNSGFTLIELLVVIAIISALGILSTGYFSRFLVQNSTYNVVDQLTNQIRKAQIYSMMGKQNSSWGVRFSSNTITLFATNNPTLNETFSVNSNISVTGFTEVTFAKTTGVPNITPTINISGNSTTKTLTVNSQGVVSR